MINLSSNNRLIACSILLAILCFCVYSSVLSNQFVSFDDGHYIVDNQFVKRGLTADTIHWAFSFHDKHGSYWHPLTWLSLMLDYQLFGLNPSWFHLVNLLLHVFSAILLFLVLHGMTNCAGRSFFTAALFALHPLNVESVAWAAERKTVLCGLFFMLTILFYMRYVRQSSLLSYLMVCVSFILGLMAKSMIVSLPVILLLLDIWPLGRYNGASCSPQPVPQRSLKWLILEKTPLFVLSCISVAVSISSLKGAYILDERNLLPISHKVANALISYSKYLCKIIWPSELAVFYPVNLQLPQWQLIVSTVVVILFSAVAIRYLNRIPWFFVGWFWFLIVLMPVMGLVRRGLWPAMADRFTYLPIIGVLILLVWGAGHLLEKCDVCLIYRYCCAVPIIIGCAFLCHFQVSYWHDTGTLFHRAIMVTSNNDIALVNLGWYRFSEGRQKEALALFKQMAAIDPFKPDFEYASGALEFKEHRYEAAAEWFEKALKRNEKHLASLFFLGLSYERSGLIEQAARAYTTLSDTKGLDPTEYRNKGAYRLREIVQPALASTISKQAELARKTDNPETRRSYADHLYRAGFWQTARSEYSKISAYQSSYEILLLMADCDRRLGNLDSAVNSLKLLLKSQSNLCNAAVMLGRMYMENGHWDEALRTYESALGGRSECQEAEFGRSFCYYAMGRWREALKGFQGIRSENPQLQFKVTQYCKRLQSF